MFLIKYPPFELKVLFCDLFVGKVFLTLGRTRKLIPPPWCKGKEGWLEPLPSVFLVIRHMSIILRLIDSPGPALQDDTFLVGHDVFHHHGSAILDFTIFSETKKIT